MSTDSVHWKQYTNTNRQRFFIFCLGNKTQNVSWLKIYFCSRWIEAGLRWAWDIGGHAAQQAGLGNHTKQSSTRHTQLTHCNAKSEIKDKNRTFPGSNCSICVVTGSFPCMNTSKQRYTDWIQEIQLVFSRYSLRTSSVGLRGNGQPLVSWYTGADLKSKIDFPDLCWS